MAWEGPGHAHRSRLPVSMDPGLRGEVLRSRIYDIMRSKSPSMIIGQYGSGDGTLKASQCSLDWIWPRDGHCGSRMGESMGSSVTFVENTCFEVGSVWVRIAVLPLTSYMNSIFLPVKGVITHDACGKMNEQMFGKHLA